MAIRRFRIAGVNDTTSLPVAGIVCKKLTPLVDFSSGAKPTMSVPATSVRGDFLDGRDRIEGVVQFIADAPSKGAPHSFVELLNC